MGAVYHVTIPAPSLHSQAKITAGMVFIGGYKAFHQYHSEPTTNGQTQLTPPRPPELLLIVDVCVCAVGRPLADHTAFNKWDKNTTRIGNQQCITAPSPGRHCTAAVPSLHHPCAIPAASLNHSSLNHPSPIPRPACSLQPNIFSRAGGSLVELTPAYKVPSLRHHCAIPAPD